MTAPSLRSSRGFSLLEVMVAVSILGFGLVVILTSQTGLFTSAQRAAKISQAVGLARCKMSEVEEKVLRDGFPITREDETGPCCDDEELEFQCAWSVIPVELPELGDMGGGADAGAGMGSAPPSLDFLTEAKDSLSAGDPTSALSGLSSMVGGGAGMAGPSMGAGALAPLAMGFIYPDLKTMLEASIRKVEVRVSWREGKFDRDLEVTQYLTNPQQGGLMDFDPNALLPEEAGQEATAPASGQGASAAPNTRGGNRR